MCLYTDEPKHYTGPWNRGRRLHGPVFFYITWTAVYVCAAYLGKWWHKDTPWDDDKPVEGVWCSCSAGKPYVWPFMMGVNLTCSTCLNIVVDQVHPGPKTVCHTCQWPVTSENVLAINIFYRQWNGNDTNTLDTSDNSQFSIPMWYHS